MDYLFFSSLLYLQFLLKDGHCAVSGWGESCNYTAECTDHRMICLSDVQSAANYSQKICICDRFHQWQGKELGCVQMYDLETILNMTLTSTDNKGKLEKDTSKMYLGSKLGGILIMTIAALCPVIIAIHCLHMRRKDRILKRELNIIKERMDSLQKNRKKSLLHQDQQLRLSA